MKYKHLFLTHVYRGGGVTTHFEKLRTLKKNSKCVKFGTKSTHFEIFFFSKCVNIGHINAL